MLNPNLTPANPVASSILTVSLLVFFQRSPHVFPARFVILSANLLANFNEIPLHRPNPGPMLKLNLGPSSCCNSIYPVIVNTLDELPTHSLLDLG
ncbi:hypothetical protein B296_00007465 [Ensete ventricosum]|uniref:Uncharacterized protein n=1 Tax=Ensete ventricosum TaxID=4639 RepID=A0A426Y8N5_ENSVE|nr:hypothetical protein B296_00007465 [Ensete ventricosum]